MYKGRFKYILLTASLLAFATFIIAYVTSTTAFSGPALTLAFILLAITVRWFPLFRGFAYSLWIFAAVSASMFYPQLFLGVGEFKYSSLIVPLLQIIMFGMGSQMSLKDFAGVIKMPKGVIAGILCQFTIMPLMGLLIVTVFKFPPEIAAGIILVGSSPSGLASNVMSFLAKANLALSVTLTAFATLLSPILTPLLMKVFAGELVAIDFWDMMIGIFNMVILPICAGLIFNLFVNKPDKLNAAIIQLVSFVGIIALKNLIGFLTKDIGFTLLFTGLGKDLIIFSVLPIMAARIFKIAAKGDKQLLDSMLSFISMLGIGIIISVITANGREGLMQVGFLLVLACLLQNIFGYSLGYLAAKVLRMPEQDCRTIALEVGMQNGGLASGLALQMGKVATVGLAPAVFGPMMNITGSSLATWWRSKNPNP